MDKWILLNNKTGRATDMYNSKNAKQMKLD